MQMVQALLLPRNDSQKEAKSVQFTHLFVLARLSECVQFPELRKSWEVAQQALSTARETAQKALSISEDMHKFTVCIAHRDSRTLERHIREIGHI
jgi:sugar diacid utilization regulator